MKLISKSSSVLIFPFNLIINIELITLKCLKLTFVVTQCLSSLTNWCLVTIIIAQNTVLSWIKVFVFYFFPSTHCVSVLALRKINLRRFLIGGEIISFTTDHFLITLPATECEQFEAASRCIIDATPSNDREKQSSPAARIPRKLQ